MNWPIISFPRSMLALIPARSGSVRIPNKNILDVRGHPLLAYSIVSAVNSRIFDRVVVCTDSQLYADISVHYGAEVPALRPANVSGSFSPDRDWIGWLFDSFPHYSQTSFAFILRPTNPFRTSRTLKRAWEQFNKGNYDTLRAVRPVSEHPGKMWVLQGESIVPLLPFANVDVPWHSNQTSALFEVYVQDASLEIFTVDRFLSSRRITGSRILPFFSHGMESLDLNTPDDLSTFIALLPSASQKLEPVNHSPWAYS